MGTVPTLNLLMPVQQHGLTLNPPERNEERKVQREKERGARTISQIICKDYKGFRQIISTEGRETEINRPEKGWHVSAVTYTVYFHLMLFKMLFSFNLDNLDALKHTFNQG